MDVQLSKNLWRSEVACQCGCGFDSMDTETVAAFQDCCNHFSIVMDVDKVVARITSGARCFEYNRLPVSEGGPGSNDNSQHPLARAIDFTIDGVEPSEVQKYLHRRWPNQYGIGSYETFTHLDTRSGGAARWDG